MSLKRAIDMYKEDDKENVGYKVIKPCADSIKEEVVSDGKT